MFPDRKFNPYVMTHLYTVNDLEDFVFQAFALSEVAESLMIQITGEYTQLRHRQKQNTAAWYHPSKIVSSVQEKFNDSDLAIDLYNKHALLFKEKILSLRKVCQLVIEPQLQIATGGSYSPPLPDALEVAEESKAHAPKEGQTQSGAQQQAAAKNLLNFGYFNQKLKQTFGLAWTQAEY
jgi:hypothetical protein